jgi:hypothetical protein
VTARGGLPIGGVGNATSGRPLYIELCGLPAVGKSTVAAHLRRAMPERTFFGRDKRRESAARIALDGMMRRDRRRVAALWRLFRYLWRERSAFPWGALRRARFIVGTAARRDFRACGNGVLLLDEGPVNYLVNVGGYGPGWRGWADILVPDPVAVESIFIFLHAGRDALDTRERQRARPGKLRVGRTGKEGITAERRTEGHRFWSARLPEAGARCLWIETDGRTPEDVAGEVVRYIARKSPR